MTHCPSCRSVAANPRFLVGALFLIGICLASSPFALAQHYLGTLSGQITDSAGARVAGARVIAVEGSTNYETKAITAAPGEYNMPSLQPGTYTVTVTAQGFRSESRTGVVLTAGQLQHVDFVLNPGTVQESIEVTAETSILDTGSAQLSTTLSAEEVTNLPNIGRNPFVMATLAPGVINTGSGGYFQGKASQFTQPFSGVAVQINAEGNGGHNRLTLNGIPDDPAERLSGASYTGFVPSPEAVQETKVQTSIFDAQVGHGNGTLTNTVVRTGSNNLHGALYYAFQNTYLNANTVEKIALNQPRTNDQLAQTGFAFSGPVYLPKLYHGRDKTYFMVAYEFYQAHQAVNYNARVPTKAERSGDFSDLCSTFTNGVCTSGVQLYDPATEDPVTHNRTPIPNNIITSMINSAGAAMIKYLPLPNNPNVPITSPQSYVSPQNSYRSTYPSFIVRFDQALGQKNKLSVIGFRSGLTQAYPLEGFPLGIGPTTSGTGYGYNVHRNNRGGSVDDVQQISDTMTLDSRFGLIYHPFGLVYPGNSNFDLSSLNITESNLPYKTFPGMYVTSDNYAGLAPGAGGQISADTLGDFTELLTKVAGRHTLNIGFEGQMSRYNVQNPQSGFGTNATTHPGFEFDRRFTQKNSVDTSVGSDATSGDPMASLLLGYPSTVNYSINVSYALQQIYVAPFIQDDWRFNSKLTFNLGARWDFESPFTERYNRQVSNFCATCVNPLQASVTGLILNGGLQYVSGSSSRYPYHSDWNNMQPRIGAAYQLFPSTVVRAGFGIIYFNTLESPIGSGYSTSTTYTNTSDNSHPLNPMSSPFPSGINNPSGKSLGLATLLGQSVSFVDPTHVQPKSAQYSLSVQQQIPGGFAVQAAYVGTRPTRLEINPNINVLPSQYLDQGAAGVTYLNTQIANPMAGKFTGTTGLNAAKISQYLLLLPYPEFGSVTKNYASMGSAPYNALQIQVTRPMRHHFSIQGNFTWQKTMLHNGVFSGTGYTSPTPFSYQDNNSTLLSNIFGIVQLPRFAARPVWQRLILGGWDFNSVLRMQNGSLVSAPGNVDIIGPVGVSNRTYGRFFNTCYETAAGALVLTTASVPACASATSIPAFRQRYAYTSQHNGNYLPVRLVFDPLVDSSLFKKFQIHESMNFEIRGEFFNVMNTAIFGGPGTGVGSSNFGAVTKNQVNDPRIGQLTARFNF